MRDPNQLLYRICPAVPGSGDAFWGRDGPEGWNFKLDVARTGQDTREEDVPAEWMANSRDSTVAATAERSIVHYHTLATVN